MSHKHSLLHDNFQDEPTIQPTFKRDQERTDVYLQHINALSFLLDLSLNGLRQRVVEGHRAAQDRELI